MARLVTASSLDLGAAKPRVRRHFDVTDQVKHGERDEQQVSGEAAVHGGGVPAIPCQARVTSE